MTETSTGVLSPLGADLKAQDPDRYLATLFAPEDRREALFALYAFDHEIAKVRRVVREPMAGLIRLQWWRDALDGIERGAVLAHPVVRGLDHALARRGLDRGFLEAAIRAREQELEERPPGDMDAFEAHVSATNGGMVRAAVTLLGAADPDLLTAADRLGQSLGLLERLRSLEVQPDGGPLWLPPALLAQHLGGGETLKEALPEQVRTLREALAARARRHLADARRLGADVPRHALPAFFPGTLAGVRLGDIHGPKERPAIAAAPFRLLWHWLRGRF
jgi:phytoene synthase